jgi:hypothetical protein
MCVAPSAIDVPHPVPGVRSLLFVVRFDKRRGQGNGAGSGGVVVRVISNSDTSTVTVCEMTSGRPSREPCGMRPQETPTLGSVRALRLARRGYIITFMPPTLSYAVLSAPEGSVCNVRAGGASRCTRRSQKSQFRRPQQKDLVLVQTPTQVTNSADAVCGPIELFQLDPPSDFFELQVGWRHADLESREDTIDRSRRKASNEASQPVAHDRSSRCAADRHRAPLGRAKATGMRSASTAQLAMYC